MEKRKVISAVLLVMTLISFVLLPFAAIFPPGAPEPPQTAFVTGANIYHAEGYMTSAEALNLADGAVLIQTTLHIANGPPVPAEDAGPPLGLPVDASAWRALELLAADASEPADPGDGQLMPHSPADRQAEDSGDEPALPPDHADTEDPAPRKIAYLTFDDGPSRTVTAGILDILAEEGIFGTFFILPHKDVDDIFRRIIDEGHVLGNHSYSHNYSRLYRSGMGPFIDDIARAQIFIRERFDYQMKLFRFPGGSMSWDRTAIARRKEVLDEMELRYFDWHIDSRDAHPRQTDKSAAALARNVLGNTNDREQVVILMHDARGRQTTLEALPLIIAGLREQDYTFDVLTNY